MAKSKTTGLFVMIMIGLVMVSIEAATHNNGGYDSKISSACLAKCIKSCVKSGVLPPLCFPACVAACSKAPQSHQNAVIKCTSNCAQSTCSKYIASDVNLVEQCVANECIQKCLPGA